MLARARDAGSADASSSSRRPPRRCRSTDASFDHLDGHVPPALRRRTRPRRSPSSRASCGRAASSRRSSSALPAGLARPAVGALRPSGPAARRPRSCDTAGARSATSSASSIRSYWERYPARAAARALACSGHPDVAVAADEPRRRRRHLGPDADERSVCDGRRGTRSRPEAGATTSRSSTRRTRRGISPTSSSAAAWRHRRLGTAQRGGRGLRARRRDRRARARRAARPTAAHEHPEPDARRPGGRSRSARRARSASSGAIAFEPWLVLLVPVGVFLVLAYNLELLGGRFHSDLWFGLAWGGFPVICGYAAVAGDLSVAALLARGVRRPPLARAARALEPRALRAPAASPPSTASSSSRRLARAPRRRSPHRGGGARAAPPRRRVGRARGGSRRVPTLEWLRVDARLDPASRRSSARSSSSCAALVARAETLARARAARTEQLVTEARRAVRARPPRRSRRRRPSSCASRSRARRPTRSPRTSRRSAGSPTSAAASSPCASGSSPTAWPSSSRPSSSASRSGCARGSPTSSAPRTRSRARVSTLEQRMRQRIADVEAKVAAGVRRARRERSTSSAPRRFGSARSSRRAPAMRSLARSRSSRRRRTTGAAPSTR